MRSDLAPRLLALPRTVRATLAGVPGPGWRAYRDHRRRLGFYAEDRPGAACYHPEHAWLSANPAAAVAAVLDCTLAAAHESLMAWLDNCEDIEHPNAPGDDHAAALSIIENHVRSQP